MSGTNGYTGVRGSENAAVNVDPSAVGLKILLLSSSYNGLTQRVHEELRARGHHVQFEVGVAEMMLHAVNSFQPDLIICPTLMSYIPEEIWRKILCLIVHPGIKGDRGPSSLDWAIAEKAPAWGVTLLEAAEDYDAGAIWATVHFPMRAVSKSSLYRHEVTEAAVKAIDIALFRFRQRGFSPELLDYEKPNIPGRARSPMKQVDRTIDWTWPTDRVMALLNAADTQPGVLDVVLGEEVYLFGPTVEGSLRGTPGEILAKRHDGICRATGDGAVWITALKKKPAEGARTLKLPATMALKGKLDSVPTVAVDGFKGNGFETYRDIWYEESNGAGFLHFDFYNGAMSTDQCARLRDAYVEAVKRPTRVLVLVGGRDFFSNGIHLNVIEASDSPADESWANINAIDDLVREVLTTGSKLTISALNGNAGAGGVMFAIAADVVWARKGVVLNPHYFGMGLFGSEYWTYSLPKRAGEDTALRLTKECQALIAGRAQELGLVDEVFSENPVDFMNNLRIKAEDLAQSSEYEELLEKKQKRRHADESERPLADYRAHELARMKRVFYDPTSFYHMDRFNFVYKVNPMKHPDLFGWKLRSSGDPANPDPGRKNGEQRTYPGKKLRAFVDDLLARLRMGNYAQVYDAAVDELQRYPKNAALLSIAGSAAYSMGRMDAADSYISQAANIQADSKVLQNAMQRIQMKRSQAHL